MPQMVKQMLCVVIMSAEKKRYIVLSGIQKWRVVGEGQGSPKSLRLCLNFLREGLRFPSKILWSIGYV